MRNQNKLRDPATLPPETTATLPRLMTQDDLCDYLQKSPAWAERARWKGEGPRFLKLGRNIRYRAEDVLQYLEENIRTATAEV